MQSTTAPSNVLRLPPAKTPIARKRGPPVALRIDTPVQNEPIAVVLGESSTSSLSSASSDAPDLAPFAAPVSAKPRSLRNMKKLSLTLPSAGSSTASLALPPSEAPTTASSAFTADSASIPPRSRAPSVSSMTTTTATTALAVRREEDGGSPTVPYADGPVEIIPGIWLGSEDNAREFDALAARGIKAILNVAKEVTSIFDTDVHGGAPSPGLSARTDIRYLKMDWSHGQSNLIQEGFPKAMAFVDAVREKGGGVLVHCQCGISRSATMVIALVMRAAATSSSSVSPEVWGLKGMHAAYAYVKQKSKWVGPNMSLLYQLLEYERTLRHGSSSPTPSDRSSSVAEDEEEWSRRRQALDEAPSEDDERESLAIRHEAEALDKAMEDRRVARKSSAGSFTSSVTSAGGVGMGPMWKSRYGGRRRAGSRASVSSALTAGSVLSEDLVEEDEEEELLCMGGGFDGTSAESSSPSPESAEAPSLPTARALPFTPHTARPKLQTPRPPPSAPATKTSFNIPPPPLTAMKSSFDLPPRIPKSKRRPAPLVGLLPPVPASPTPGSSMQPPAPAQPAAHMPAPLPSAPVPTPSPAVLPLPRRTRTASAKPTPPPLMLRTLSNTMMPMHRPAPPPSSGPSQTLFVFPPSPKHAGTRTPATMMLVSHGPPVPFPTLPAHRVAKEKRHGRTRSFVTLGVPPTPTTACSRVDARGWFGADP